MGCRVSSEDIHVGHHDSKTSLSVLQQVSQEDHSNARSNSQTTFINQPGGSESVLATNELDVKTTSSSVQYKIKTDVDNSKVMGSMSSDKVESLKVAKQNTSPTESPVKMIPIENEQHNTPNKSDSSVITTKQPLVTHEVHHDKQLHNNPGTQANTQHAEAARSSGGDTHAGSHKYKKNKHDATSQHLNDKKSKTAKQSRQKENKSKKELPEKDTNELIEKYNQALRVIDQHPAELQAREQEIRHLQAKSKTSEHNLQTSIDILTKENEDLKNKIEKHKSSSKLKLEKLQTKHAGKVDGLAKDAAKLQQEIDELKQANDDLKNRLSAAFGAKLQDNNPNIADLSDRNRPNKLAERFSELYDNEWTNCFEVLTKHKHIVEKEAIGQMLQACLIIYQDCSTNASNDLQTLTQALDRFDAEPDIRLVKDLKEKRKRRFENDIKRLRQPIEKKIITIFKDTTKEKTVAQFWSKCMEICWLMVIQDPPVSMDARTNQLGEIFDAALYRPYTKSGRYIEFIVWPTLRLTENGPLLYKGVAQGADAFEQYSDCVDKDVHTVKRSRSKVAHEPLNEDTSNAVDDIKLSSKMANIGMGTYELENTEEQNTRNNQTPADQTTDTMVGITNDSAACVIPTAQAIHSKSSSDTDDRDNVNVDTFDTKTKPVSDEIKAEYLPDAQTPKTSPESKVKDGERSKEDKIKTNEKRNMKSFDAEQSNNENPTNLIASRRKKKADENSQRGGSTENEAKQSKQFDTKKTAPSSQQLVAKNKTEDQTVSSNVNVKQMAALLRGTADSASRAKNSTKIQVNYANANTTKQFK